MSFRESSPNMQMSLTGFYYQLPEHKRKKMDESREAAFYNNVVARIDEEPFRALYCEDNGAPNKPIRQMVGGYILMHHKNFSTRELFNQIDFNLLTDVVVAPNNEDDANIHKERVEKIKEKTPEFNENHTDGGYGSKDVDKKMEKHEVRHVVTGIRGRRSEVEIDIEEKGETYCVSCPKQSAEVTKTRKRWKASFDTDICKECSAGQSCPTKQQKSCRAFYFAREDFLARQRWKNLEKIPEKRHKLRPNVEATVKEFSGVFNHKGKLPYRGAFRTQVYAYCMAIGVNFGRVARQKRRKFGKSAAGARNLPPTAAKHYQKMLNFTFSLTKGFFERSKIYFTQFFFSGWSYPWLGEHAK